MYAGSQSLTRTLTAVEKVSYQCTVLHFLNGTVCLCACVCGGWGGIHVTKERKYVKLMSTTNASQHEMFFSGE